MSAAGQKYSAGIVLMPSLPAPDCLDVEYAKRAASEKEPQLIPRSEDLRAQYMSPLGTVRLHIPYNWSPETE